MTSSVLTYSTSTLTTSLNFLSRFFRPPWTISVDLVLPVFSARYDLTIIVQLHHGGSMNLLYVLCLILLSLAAGRSDREDFVFSRHKSGYEDSNRS